MTTAIDTTRTDKWARLQFTTADRLSKALDFADMSVQEMADNLGMSRQTVGNYMSGRTTPRLVVLKQWALTTGVPLEWLQTGHFPKPQPRD